MYDEKHQLARNRHLNGYQLAKLHTFEIAARQGSFVLAAEELAITPSAVSHRINNLEAELGFKLFQRFHRRIRTDPRGRAVILGVEIVTQLSQSGNTGD